MNILLDNVNPNSSTGPNTFGSRLAHQLMRMGHHVMFMHECTPDVHVSFIQQTQHVLAKQTVLRLDGIEFKPQNFMSANAAILNAYKKFDKVVVQSDFDRQMIEVHFGKRDNVHVVGNGIVLEKVSPSFVLPRNPEEKIFVCSANWHGQKRLCDNVRLFQQIRSQLGGNAKLYVLGGGRPSVEGVDLTNVQYLGHQSHETCLGIYAQADYGIHLAFLDHFPNTVVEMLSQGLPVIHTDSGGTKEVVRGNGPMIAESTPYNFELMDYDHPYDLDFSGFVLPEERPVVSVGHLDIKVVAEKYLEVFQ